MPIVTIQVTREGVTAEQKAALIKGATDLLKDVLNKEWDPLESTCRHASLSIL